MSSLPSTFGKLTQAKHEVKKRGSPKFQRALEIAQLALKHRENQRQKQRIICFVASPIEDDERTLTILAKKLRKNSVAVDIVSLANSELDDQNKEKLERFINEVNDEDNSHMETFYPSDQQLPHILVSTPIINAGAGAGDGGTDSGFGGFNVDPEMDPELATALKLSLEEEKKRQEVRKFSLSLARTRLKSLIAALGVLHL